LKKRAFKNADVSYSLYKIGNFEKTRVQKTPMQAIRFIKSEILKKRAFKNADVG
jgi:hypothetical protein